MRSHAPLGPKLLAADVGCRSKQAAELSCAAKLRNPPRIPVELAWAVDAPRPAPGPPTHGNSSPVGGFPGAALDLSMTAAATMLRGGEAVLHAGPGACVRMRSRGVASRGQTRLARPTFPGLRST